jgi:hypothetical protein
MRRIGVMIALMESYPEGQLRAAAFRRGPAKLWLGGDRNIRTPSVFAASRTSASI